MEGQTKVICNSQRQNDAEGNRHSQTPWLFYIPGTFVSIYFGDKASIEYDFLSITPQIYVFSPTILYIKNGASKHSAIFPTSQTTIIMLS